MWLPFSLMWTGAGASHVLGRSAERPGLARPRPGPSGHAQGPRGHAQGAVARTAPARPALEAPRNGQRAA